MDRDRTEGAAQVAEGVAEEEIGRLAGDGSLYAEGLGRQAAGHAQQLYGEVKDGVRESVDRATAAAEDAYREGRRRVGAGADAITAQVEANPAMAILLACAAGYLLGFTLRTMRR